MIDILDRVGIVAFAFAGVELGMRRRLDVVGLVIVGVITATGGGLIRDVVLGRVPYVFEREDYLLLAAGSSLMAIPLNLWRWRVVDSGLFVADAAGLGAFAVAGALAAIRADLGWPAALVLAVVTATGGGAIRDLLLGRVPTVLHSEANATAAAAGGLVTWALEPWQVGWAALGGIAAAALIRVGSRAFHLHLPAPMARR